MKEQGKIDKFIGDQLSVWPLAAANFRALKEAECRRVEVDGLEVCLQHNPGRLRSTSAKVDSESIKARKCFLCAENRPAEQLSLPFDGRHGRKYEILLNPYPIFPRHLVIASVNHREQSIWHKFGDLADLAHHYTDFTFFYNGPRCGASAPDHLHFQACLRNSLPLEVEADRLLSAIAQVHKDSGVPDGEELTEIPEALAEDLAFVTSVQEAQLYHYRHFTKGVFALRARTSKSMMKLFYRLLDCAPVPEGEKEPMFNLLVWYAPVGKASKRPSGYTHGLADFEYRAVVFFRQRHRSHHFFAEGGAHLGLSPGCADMAGLFIVPSAEDYARLDGRLLREVLSEVSVSEEAEADIIWRLTRTQQLLNVGIMAADEISFEILSDGAGRQKVSFRGGRIEYNGALYDELFFEAKTMSTLFAEPMFRLYDVVIGVGFHWQRKMDQQFAGSLKFIVDEGKVVAVNVIGVEDYLLSVIASEMKSSASLEYLKAHSVISRSWVMSQLARRRRKALSAESSTDSAAAEDAAAGNPAVTGSVAAVESTSAEAAGTGDPVQSLSAESRTDSTEAEGAAAVNLAVPVETPVLEEIPELIRWYGHEDHRKFDVCADDHCQRYQGLTMVAGDRVRQAIDATWGQVLVYDGEICDARFCKCCGGRTEKFSSCWEDKDFPYLPSLPDTPRHEAGGEPFCHTADRRILSQVLNDYDLETADFYEWTEEYTRATISTMIQERSGMDIGLVQALVPIERGESGRIVRLRVEGSLGSFIVGKELMIRRILSPSHLKSSAFDIRFEGDRVILHGHGWGHGVGLCQIGAAVMTDRGYSYAEVLRHYYPGAELVRK